MSSTPDVAVLLYDGDCGLCQQCVDVLRRWVRPDSVRIVAFQRVDVTQWGLTDAQCAEAVQWVMADGARRSGGAALAACLRRGRAPWSWVGRVLERWPVSWVRDAIYGVVARNRHLWPFAPTRCAR